jgi:TPR repeat protein
MAIHYFRKGAEKEDGHCCGYLAEMYRKGEGILINHAEALRIGEIAPAKGLAWAMVGLATMLEAGEGTPPNAAKAVDWYRRAREFDNANAAERFANLHCDDRGVPKDIETAKPFTQKRLPADPRNRIKPQQ